MNDVMIDLETLGKTPRAAVVQIGAVQFDPTTGKLGREFRTRVKPSQDREIDGDTVAWWMAQSDDARRSVFLKGGGLPAVGLVDALSDFAIWLNDVCGSPSQLALHGVWSHGILFDVAILEDAYRQIGEKVPWSYRAPRDTRTLFALAAPTVDAGKVIDDLVGPPPADFVQHDALHDARRQALAVCNAYSRLGLAKRG